MPDFQALWVEENSDGSFSQNIITRNIDDLPAGDVLIKVHYSSINYKDALSTFGNKGVTKRYPFTPGIDVAGVIEESTDVQWKPGQEVIVNGFDLGMNTMGGFGQYVRVPAQWVVAKPSNLTLKETMIYGTAGFTAAQCLLRLEHEGIRPDQGKILVTGATGGVGSVAIALLAQAGYQAVAATGKLDQSDFLHKIGAHEVIDRAELLKGAEKAMLPSRWAAAIDTVGGPTLFNVIKSINYRGAVAACGNASAPDFAGNVFPFILRGVSLLGIDSANCPIELKKTIWQKLDTDWHLPQLSTLITEITLAELINYLTRTYKGQNVGRVVVSLW